MYSLKCYNCIEFGKESEKDTVCSKSILEADEDKYLKDCSLDTCQRSHNTALSIYAVTMLCTTKDYCDAIRKLARIAEVTTVVSHAVQLINATRARLFSSASL